MIMTIEDMARYNIGCGQYSAKQPCSDEARAFQGQDCRHTIRHPDSFEQHRRNGSHGHGRQLLPLNAVRPITLLIAWVEIRECRVLLRSVDRGFTGQAWSKVMVGDAAPVSSKR
jgi:hypothetical protein